MKDTNIHVSALACELNVKCVYHEVLQQIKYLEKHISQPSDFVALYGIYCTNF